MHLIVAYVYAPLFEYTLHKLAHVINMQFHMDHHVSHHKGHVIGAEAWVLIPVCASMYFHQWFVCIGFMRYWVVHQIIHRAPHLLPRLAEHHLNHHKNAKHSYAVSAQWPDKVIEYLVTYI